MGLKFNNCLFWESYETHVFGSKIKRFQWLNTAGVLLRTTQQRVHILQTDKDELLFNRAVDYNTHTHTHTHIYIYIYIYIYLTFMNPCIVIQLCK